MGPGGMGSMGAGGMGAGGMGPGSMGPGNQYSQMQMGGQMGGPMGGQMGGGMGRGGMGGSGQMPPLPLGAAPFKPAQPVVSCEQS